MGKSPRGLDSAPPKSLTLNEHENSLYRTRGSSGCCLMTFDQKALELTFRTWLLPVGWWELSCPPARVCPDPCLPPQVIRGPAVHPLLLHRLHTLPLLHLRTPGGGLHRMHLQQLLHLTELASHLPGPVSPPSSDENKDKLLLLRHAFNSVRLEELKTTASCLNPKYWKTSHDSAGDPSLAWGL